MPKPLKDYTDDTCRLLQKHCVKETAVQWYVFLWEGSYWAEEEVCGERLPPVFFGLRGDSLKSLKERWFAMEQRTFEVDEDEWDG
jgi:hypothetical protein